jgi:exodeoxyribonuclease-5
MSESFTPSDLQAKAISGIKDWFRHRTADQQVFRVFGYAGTGKTTITRHAIDELGLDTMTREDGGAGGCVPGGVLYAVFTGKAALVMTRKGTPASTIHSLIYRLSEATPDEIERVKTEIAEISGKLPTLDPAIRLFEESRLRSLEIRLDDIHKPRFVFNEQSMVRDAALIVLDEVSMVGDEMARDLLAFGKPILVLGDPGQLPPQGRGRLHPSGARRDADRDPPPSRRERDHPPRDHGAPGSAHPLRRARCLRLEDAAQLGDARADAARRPGDLRPQRHPHPAQHRDESRRRVRWRLSDR